MNLNLLRMKRFRKMNLNPLRLIVLPFMKCYIISVTQRIRPGAHITKQYDYGIIIPLWKRITDFVPPNQHNITIKRVTLKQYINRFCPNVQNDDGDYKNGYNATEVIELWDEAVKSFVDNISKYRTNNNIKN